MTLDRDRALALMHEYTASDALRKHMYAVEIAMRAMAERAGEDAEAWGLVGSAARLRLRALSQRRPLATEEHPAEGVRHPERARASPRRAAAPSWATRPTPASRATRRWPGRSSRWTSCAASWWPARWSGPSRSLAGSRGLERQEEAQGQGVRPRREPGGRDPGRGRAGRAARRAHRLRARGAPARTSAARPRRRMTGAGAGLAACRAEQSVASAINRAAGGRPIPGNQVTPADRRPVRLRRDARRHRRPPPAGSTSRTTSSAPTPPAGASPRRSPRARARACTVRVLYDGLGCVDHAALLLARAARAPASRCARFRPLSPLDLVANLSRNHRKLVVADGARAVIGGLCIGCEWTGEGTRGRACLARHRGRDRRPGRRGAGPGLRADLGRRRRRVCPTSTWPAGSRRRARRRSASSAASRAGSAPTGSSSCWPPGSHRAALDHRRVPGGAAPAVPGAAATPRATAWTSACWCPARATSRWCGTSPASATGELLRSGVRIFEWDGPMLHAKTIVADGRWTRVGSSNLNPSSLVGNYELDVLIEDPGLGEAMERQFRLDVARSREVIRRPARGPQRISAALPAVLQPRGSRGPVFAPPPDRARAPPAGRPGRARPDHQRPPLDLPPPQRDPDLPGRPVLRPAASSPPTPSASSAAGWRSAPGGRRSGGEGGKAGGRKGVRGRLGEVIGGLPSSRWRGSASPHALTPSRPHALTPARLPASRLPALCDPRPSRRICRGCPPGLSSDFDPDHGIA